MMHLIATIVALISPAVAIFAEPAPVAPRVGDTFEIRHEYETEDKAEDGSSSGSSSGHTTILERVIGVRPDGLELEYDFPNEASEEDRSREWQFPARIFRPFSGTPQLLNRADLEVRRDAWLKRWKIDPGACGSWYFTWNAFKVECDPQSVIASMEEYNLWHIGLSDGVPYRTRQAREAAPLKILAGSNPVSFVVEMTVDPDQWRQERAKTDVIVSQLMGKPQTLDEALRARSGEEVSGTITVTLDTDRSGQVRKRTELVTLTIKGPDGKTETQSRKEIVERRIVSEPNR